MAKMHFISGLMGVHRIAALAAGECRSEAGTAGARCTAAAADTAFLASELLFSLRIYEPFRGWR